MYIPIFIIKKASFLRNSHQRLNTYSHWSVLCQIASHSCKGTWKREYLAGHIGVLYEADVVLARQKWCLTLARQSTVSSALGYSNLECLGQEKVEKLMVQHILMQAGAAWKLVQTKRAEEWSKQAFLLLLNSYTIRFIPPFTSWQINISNRCGPLCFLRLPFRHLWVTRVGGKPGCLECGYNTVCHPLHYGNYH